MASTLYLFFLVLLAPSVLSVAPVLKQYRFSQVGVSVPFYKNINPKTDYVAPVDASRITSNAVLSQINFFYHETASLDIILSSGYVLAGVQLYIRGIREWTDMKAGTKKDVRSGGGLYVYTRIGYDGSSLTLGEGSTGSGADWMLIFSPEMAKRTDWWATNSDLTGGTPMALCAKEDETCKKAIVTATASNFKPELNKQQTVATTDGGQPIAKLVSVITELMKTDKSEHQEQGFWHSISLKDYLIRIVYKSSSSSPLTKDQVIEFVKTNIAKNADLNAKWKDKLDELVIYHPLKTSGKNKVSAVTNAAVKVGSLYKPS